MTASLPAFGDHLSRSNIHTSSVAPLKASWIKRSQLAPWNRATQRTTSPNMTMESERTRVTAHDLGGADDIDTAWRSRTYTATSMTPRTRLYGMSQMRSAAEMDGNTKKENH